MVTSNRSAAPSVGAVRAAFAEFLGSLLLVATVVGSGIMAERLSRGNDGIALLGNTLATAAALFVLITAFSPISGAHFNPLVTLLALLGGSLERRRAALFLGAQFVGAAFGAVLANLMFELDAVVLSSRPRTGPAQWLSEIVATFGLILAIEGVGRARPRAVPAAVALWITAAYWFTASTSFANPAVTLARSLSATFAGIRPADVGGFIAAQIVGACLGALAARRLFENAPPDGAES